MRLAALFFHLPLSLSHSSRPHTHTHLSHHLCCIYIASLQMDRLGPVCKCFLFFSLVLLKAYNSLSLLTNCSRGMSWQREFGHCKQLVEMAYRVDPCVNNGFGFTCNFHKAHKDSYYRGDICIRICLWFLG